MAAGRAGLIETAGRDARRWRARCPSTGGVYFVPAFTGLGAPYWDTHARGAITGLTRGTARPRSCGRRWRRSPTRRATDGGHRGRPACRCAELRVDGGAAANDFLMQFQADLLGCPVNRSRYLESTGMGAAFLAGLAVGVWDSPEAVAALRTSERAFVPVMDTAERARLYAGWQAAVQRVKSGGTNCALRIAGQAPSTADIWGNGSSGVDMVR